MEGPYYVALSPESYREELQSSGFKIIRGNEDDVAAIQSHNTTLGELAEMAQEYPELIARAVMGNTDIPYDVLARVVKEACDEILGLEQFEGVVSVKKQWITLVAQKIETAPIDVLPPSSAVSTIDVGVPPQRIELAPPAGISPVDRSASLEMTPFEPSRPLEMSEPLVPSRDLVMSPPLKVSQDLAMSEPLELSTEVGAGPESAGTLRIAIPAFDNQAEVESAVRKALGDRNVEIVISPTQDRERIVGDLRKTASLGLVIDTPEVDKVETMLGNVLNELDAYSLLREHPALTSGRLGDIKRELLVRISSDPRLQREIKSSEADYTLSNIDLLALAKFEPMTRYRFSRRTMELTEERPRIAAVPAALIENNPALRTRIANKRIQMGMLEGQEDPIKDVLVITDPKITDENLDAYLETLGVEQIFNRENGNTITHAELAAECGTQGLAIARISDEKMEDVVRQVANRKLGCEAERGDIAVVGGVRALVTMLIQGILTGVSEGDEAYYEMIIERLANDGELDPEVAARLKEAREQIFEKGTVDHRRYNEELEEFKESVEVFKRNA